MKEFFENRMLLLSDTGTSYGLTELRGWLAQELTHAQPGTDRLKAEIEAEAYLVGIVMAEAAAIRTRSIP